MGLVKCWARDAKRAAQAINAKAEALDKLRAFVRLSNGTAT